MKLIAAFAVGVLVGASGLLMVLTVQYQQFQVARHAIFEIIAKMPPLTGALPVHRTMKNKMNDPICDEDFGDAPNRAELAKRVAKESGVRYAGSAAAHNGICQ